MKTFAKNSLKKLNRIPMKNWSAPAIISVFIIVCMIIVYSFESIGLLNKERNLDMRLTNPESLIKTTYKDLKIIHADKFMDNQTNSINNLNIEFNNQLRKDFVLNKINVHSKISKEIFIETINKILIDGALEQMRFENSTYDNNFILKNKRINNNEVFGSKGIPGKSNNENFYNLDESKKCDQIENKIRNYINMIENPKNEDKKTAENDDKNILYFDM